MQKNLNWTWCVQKVYHLPKFYSQLKMTKIRIKHKTTKPQEGGNVWWITPFLCVFVWPFLLPFTIISSEHKYRNKQANMFSSASRGDNSLATSSLSEKTPKNALVHHSFSAEVAQWVKYTPSILAEIDPKNGLSNEVIPKN